jgi:2-polyprenyl-3-methyl-5-hydroxy-6-metoxy-1,4-benzoquinol methylase
VSASVEGRDIDARELVWTPEMVARFWAFERRHPENYFSFQVGAVLARYFKHHLQGKVVDFGAGTGYLVEELLAAGICCAATEFGEAAVLDLAKQFVGNSGFLGVRDVGNLADWDNTFDAALLIEVVEHLYDRELRDCLASVRGLLKPGGRLIVTTPNSEDRSKLFISSPESGLLFHRFQHVRSWTPQLLVETMKANGFEISTVGTTDFGAHPLALWRTMSLTLRIARAVAKRTFDRRPHLYCVVTKAHG